MNTQEITANINALPFAQKLEVLHALERSLASEIENKNIAIAEARLARLDAGIDKAVPWEDVRRSLFKYS